MRDLEGYVFKVHTGIEYTIKTGFNSMAIELAIAGKYQPFKFSHHPPFFNTYSIKLSRFLFGKFR